MFSFESYINLPMVWGAILVIAIMLYVILDGFGLGVGILFPFAPTDDCRDKMINSIAPFWDGNETWLVLGGGGLFAAFPLAYSIVMPAMYMPIMFMLIALIFRGVSLEFRFKASKKGRKLWDLGFHFGSLFAGFLQGMILGALVQGITIKDMAFAGGPFDWVSAFSMMTGAALVTGYILIGSTWLILKTEHDTQTWARKTASYILLFVLFFMGAVSLWMPIVDKVAFDRWFTLPNFIYLLPIPLGVIVGAFGLIFALKHKREAAPFYLTIFLFLLGFAGLIVSLWPYVIPRSLTLAQAAAAPESQSLMLVGVVIILPIIFIYTGYSYYVFRGKVSKDAMY